MKSDNKIDLDELSTTDITYLANEYIHHDRNRRIFLKRYIRGFTIQKIVDTEFDEENEIISIDQTKRILKKCMQSVLKHVSLIDGTVRVAK